MTKREFEQRAGFVTSERMYKVIENMYMDLNMNKDAFCEAYKTDADGLATKIQREADKADMAEQAENLKTITK